MYYHVYPFHMLNIEYAMKNKAYYFKNNIY